MLAIEIAPENRQLIAAMNNGVIPETEPPVAHYLVFQDPYSGADPEVMDIVELRAICAKRNAHARVMTIISD
jgi:hypothetical protein